MGVETLRESINKLGFTQVDNIIFDRILPELSHIAQLLLLSIWRQTLGWNKKSDRISYADFKKKTNTSQNKTINSGLKELKNKNLIICYGKKRGKMEYEINLETVSKYFSEEDS